METVKRRLSPTGDEEPAKRARRVSERRPRTPRAQNSPKPAPAAGDGSYALLGSRKLLAPATVAPGMPEWLTKPLLVNRDLDEKTSLKTTGLSKRLRVQLRAKEIHSLFPVQSICIPEVLRSFSQRSLLRPRDMCITAPTGSGKTLCYVLPIVQSLERFVSPKLRCLCVLPGADIASQVYDEFVKYCSAHMSVVLLSTHRSLEDDWKQMLKQPVIVVCTPGRLIEQLHQGLDLSNLEYLVIDEVDRAMNVDAQDWLHVLLAHSSFPHDHCQKLLFSATLTRNPRQLHRLQLFMPRLIAVGREKRIAIPKTLTEWVCPLAADDSRKKVAAILCLLDKFKTVLCFMDSRVDAARLQQLLAAMDVSVDAITANLPATKRRRIVRRFNEGQIRLLVCSDALARGMDLTKVDCVLNYAPPKHIRTYVHRAGRTARAGKPGSVVTLVERAKMKALRQMRAQLDEEGGAEEGAGMAELEMEEDKLRGYLERMDAVLAKQREAQSGDEDSPAPG